MVTPVVRYWVALFHHCAWGLVSLNVNAFFLDYFFRLMSILCRSQRCNIVCVGLQYIVSLLVGVTPQFIICTYLIVCMYILGLP